MTMAAEIIAPRTIGADPRKFQIIPVSRLVIEKEIQRLLSDDRVNRIVIEFDWNRFECLTVIPIGNGFFRIVEGQHRCEAVRRLDDNGKVPCMVLPDANLGIEREAALGLEFSTGRVRHAPYEAWLSRLRSGESHEVMAEAVLREFNLRLGRTQSTRTISAVSTVTKIIHGAKLMPEDGAEHLRKVLTIITQTWPEHDASSGTSRFDYRLMEAIGFIVSRNPELNMRRMVDALRTKMAQRWVNDVLTNRNGMPTRVLVANAMITQYNKSLAAKNKLTVR